ncbi:MAG: 2-oxo acid dehydrogenase subunit E2 [Bacteroidia bacterium]|nr:2-oxo acid dehydrogenase subunit E2 [Bacteroidia bacterium]
MAKIKIVMPKMGESIIEATVLKWLKQVGDTVEMDEPIMEIATDKVDSEVPSPEDGKIIETHFKEGDVVPVGELIAVIETGGDGGDSQEPAASNGQVSKEPVLETVAAPVASPVLETAAPVLSKGEGSRFYSPLVLNIARTEGVSMPELEGISGSGHEGRVTKNDILSYLKGPRTTQPAVATPAAKQTTVVSSSSNGAPYTIQQKKFSHSGNLEIQEMDRMRKMIAENMVYSKAVSAHVTSFVEADVTNLVNWREKNKKAFEQKYGEKLTFTPMFVEAIATALREHPMVNISVDGDNLIVKKDINVGIAVALPTDNLIVPVIRNADRMNLVGLATQVNDLAARARINKLKMEELEGGTYTVSNVGTFGNVMGTPIIMQPQVAIMAMGAIRKKPAVVETPEGDFIGIRQMMFLSHSYDHRVVDGALGGRFVRRVADLLEQWDPNRAV